jgi:hypothetical protein
MKFLKLNCPAITYIGIDNSMEFKQKTINILLLPNKALLLAKFV